MYTLFGNKAWAGLNRECREGVERAVWPQILAGQCALPLLQGVSHRKWEGRIHGLICRGAITERGVQIEALVMITVSSVLGTKFWRFKLFYPLS